MDGTQRPYWRYSGMTDIKNIRVIIVEDDPFIAADIQDIIEEAGGLVVNVIPSLKEALLAAETEAVDLFTLDFEIISGTTEPVAKKLSERDIPFVAISGKSEKLKKMPEFERSVILSKPLNSVLLMDAIKVARQRIN